MSMDSSQTTSVISALGTLVGYIGAEAATEDVFERLLWPQRFFNDVSRQDFLQIGFLTPMGGLLVYEDTRVDRHVDILVELSSR
jgi:hypothetical protein